MYKSQWKGGEEMKHFIPTKIPLRKKFNLELHKKFYGIAVELGDSAEEVVEEAFQKAESEGTLPDWLYSYIHNTKYSEEDYKGLDFVFTTDVGPVFIQVKSSRFGKKKFERNHTSRHRIKIRIVIINVCDSLEHIYGQVMSEISLGRDEIIATRR